MPTSRQSLCIRNLRILLVVFTILVGIVFSFVTMYYGLFTVERVTVGGNERVSSEEILKRSGIIKGKTTVLFFEDRMSEKILKSPWIVNVEISRDFPEGISIRVEEANPFCLLLKDTGILYYVSENGKVLGRANSHDGLDFPILIGEVIGNPEIVGEALEILRLSEKSNILPWNEISEINLNSIYGITVFTIDGRRIDFGKDKIAEKWNKIEKIITHSREINLTEDYINVSSERIGVVNHKL